MEEIRWVQFHSPMFHAGKNFGDKIEVKRHEGLKILFDEKERRFHIDYKGRKAVMPEMSAFIWESVGNDDIPMIVNEHRTERFEGRLEAQVSTPMGHVFEGKGKGKTKS